MYVTFYNVVDSKCKFQGSFYRTPH